MNPNVWQLTIKKDPWVKWIILLILWSLPSRLLKFANKSEQFHSVQNRKKRLAPSDTAVKVTYSFWLLAIIVVWVTLACVAFSINHDMVGRAKQRIVLGVCSGNGVTRRFREVWWGNRVQWAGTFRRSAAIRVDFGRRSSSFFLLSTLYNLEK